MRVRFGDLVFDDEARRLTCAGEVRALSPKAFRLLQLLLQARPRALSKQELHDHLWPQTFVSHTSLARVVNEVRGAVGDDPHRRSIVRTVHGFGYAFSAPVVEIGRAAAGESSACGLLWFGRVVPLPEGESFIGRGPECVVRVPSSRVSRRHARILVRNGQATLEDLASKNGTFVGKRRIDHPTPLSDGDEVEVGPAVLVYCAPAPSRSTETGTD